jgi:hypothetical protein
LSAQAWLPALRLQIDPSRFPSFPAFVKRPGLEISRSQPGAIDPPNRFHI